MTTRCTMIADALEGSGGQMGCQSVSVVVLTHNEEANLALCLASVAGWTAATFIVDSGSTDRTVEIAARYGAKVVEHRFESHAKQWAWALGNLPLTTEWVLALDADQRVTPGLATEISSLHSTALEGIDGLYLNRRQIFRGRWIRHGGYYPKYLLKLFRRTSVRTDARDLVDHHFYVTGRTAKLRHDLIEANQKEDDISFWIEKHNRYARLLAAEELDRRRPAAGAPMKSVWFGTPDQRTLALKRVWLRLPLYVRPLLYFFYRYFLRLGFLDGKQGAIFHFLQAFWFRLLVDINLDEIRYSIHQ